MVLSFYKHNHTHKIAIQDSNFQVGLRVYVTNLNHGMLVTFLWNKIKTTLHNCNMANSETRNNVFFYFKITFTSGKPQTTFEQRDMVLMIAFVDNQSAEPHSHQDFQKNHIPAFPPPYRNLGDNVVPSFDCNPYGNAE